MNRLEQSDYVLRKNRSELGLQYLSLKYKKVEEIACVGNKPGVCACTLPDT